MRARSLGGLSNDVISSKSSKVGICIEKKFTSGVAPVHIIPPLFKHYSYTHLTTTD